jgi:tripartite-type tricarboxylate transporter receptor subunit TctC
MTLAAAAGCTTAAEQYDIQYPSWFGCWPPRMREDIVNKLSAEFNKALNHRRAGGAR